MDDVFEYVKTFYDKPHRKYHNLDHIISMLKYAGNEISEELYYAILFHDIIYDPYSNTNEEDSCIEFIKYYDNNPLLKKINKHKICSLIMKTKNHFVINNTGDEKLILEADISVFDGNTVQLLEYEKGIFLEYQKTTIQEYLKHRIIFLKKFKNFYTSSNCDFLIDYLKNKIFKVGIYAGSFNPFHNGHLNICEQAEEIFDKVILAQGKNSDKQSPYLLHSTIRQIISYDGLITKLFNDEHQMEKYLIRGIRNSFDVNDESALRRFIHDVKIIPSVYFLCDKQYEHISSSMIKSIQQFDNSLSLKYIPTII